MRMAGAVTLGVVIVELLLAGAFVLGFYWLEGLRWGVLFSGVLLLLIVLPWLGELKVVFDSSGPRAGVKIGWWGRVSFVETKDTRHVLIRVMGIPIRRRSEKQPKESPTPVEQVREGERGAVSEQAAEAEAERPRKATPRRADWWRRLDSETVEGFSRAIGSGLGATCELVWGAEQIRISVQDPTQRENADSAIEQVFGRRQVGPLDVTVSKASCERRVRAVYRIGLLRAGLAGAQVLIDGRLPQFVRRMKQRRDRCAVVDEDQRIVEQIVEQAASREEDEG